MFRRILSPRQARSQSSTNVKFNGHNRQDSDGGEEIRNSSYGDPDKFNSPVRSQSMVACLTSEMNPPLPPRNVRPLQDSESSLYVTPADTLRTKAVANSSPHVHSPSGGSQGSGTTATEPSLDAHPTKSERRVMQLHQLTMNQRRGQGGTPVTNVDKPMPSSNGHHRTHSFGNVTENSEYSVPFQSNARAPVKPPRSMVGPQAVRLDSNDRIIPINPPSTTSPQPSSDRSNTNSPSSPLSNQSSEQEALPRQDDGNSDYAVPWDRSRIFQNIPHRNIRKSQGRKKNEDSGFSDDSTSLSYRSRGDRDEIQHQVVRNEEPKPRSGSLREHSPPPLGRNVFHYPSTKEPMMSYGQEPSPPPPDLPYDPARPHRNRPVSERVHLRDGSTSPVSSGGVGGSRGEDIGYHRRHLPTQPRLDLTPEPLRVDSYPPPPPRERDERDDPRRPSNPSTAVMIDVSIPLEDQPWYHGHVTRAEAEEILRNHPDFSFLVRKSESCQTDFSLSIRDTSSGAGGFYHLRLVFDRDPTPGYVLGQFSNHFEKVTECIAFYTKQRLNIRGAEHKRLRFPIPRSYPMDRAHGFITTIGV